VPSANPADTSFLKECFESFQLKIVLEALAPGLEKDGELWKRGNSLE
jgi:hypothetical protein